MWSRMRKTMLALFQRSPREMTPLELLHQQNTEAMRTITNLIDIGEPPADWKTPQEIQRRRAEDQLS